MALGKALRGVAAAVAGVAWAAGAAGAATIFPPGAEPALDAHMVRHDRQFATVNAAPFGLSLNAHMDWPDPADRAASRALIDQFLAQDASDDFEAVTGKHVFEVLNRYGEYGDLGFFGGVALAGTAFRYRALKAEGAPPEVLAEARARVVRAAEAWHVFYVVTGGGGLVARGVRRMVSEDPADPPLPVDLPELVPLFDAGGAPLPQPKDNGVYRADASGGVLPDGVWIWKDSCSKDQLVGQVLGLVSLHDALKDDPDVDQALVARLAEDARGVGQMLMTERYLDPLETALGVAGAGPYDLIIMDADGRATFYHDLNPLSLEKVYFSEEDGVYNLFNLVMSWAVIKGLHHVTGDPELEAYLYEDLLGAREYPRKLAERATAGALDYIYAGTATNFDVPDMTGVALFLALYTESDPAVRAPLQEFLEHGWWLREGETHTARLAKQPLWHALYLAVTEAGTSAALAGELRDLLLAFDLGPYWDDARINCDADEIAARECLAVDDVTVLTLEDTSPSGAWMATEALDPSIRPPSDFDARSNPFAVNGGGAGDRLNPGGDLLAAYWLARATPARAPGEPHVSPFARPHIPIGGEPPGPTADEAEDEGDAGPADPGPDPGGDAPAADADAAAPDGAEAEPTVKAGGGGGCRGGEAPGPAWLLALALLALATRRR